RVLRGSGLAHVLRQGCQQTRTGRVRAPGGAAEGADDLLALRAPGGGHAAARHRADAHGGYWRDQAERGQAPVRDEPWAGAARAPPNDRSVLPRVRSAVSRGTIRRRPGLQRRAPRLHHALTRAPAQGGILAARRTARAPDAPRLGGRQGRAASGTARGVAPRSRAAD